MLALIRKKICSILKINQKDGLKYECIKICLIYFIIGFCWIYFSDRIAHELASNNGMLLIISTYKGWLYIIVTSTVLYFLIGSLIKKVDSAEKKLSESCEKLSAVNEKLREYVQQLTISREELRVQYDQIAESEKKLSESEEKNRAIIKAMPDLLFVIDDEGYFIDCMANNENLLLMPEKTFVGKKLCEVMPEEISRLACEKMQLVLKNGTSENFQYKLEISNVEQYFELRMVKNNDKEILAIARDVTTQKQNELQLKMNEERYKTLVSEMQQGLALFEGSPDKNGEIVDLKLIDANESYERLTGLKKKDTLGKAFLDIFPSMEKSLIEKIENVVKTGESIHYERYKQEIGKYHEVIVYRPKKLQFAAIVTDITERKQLEYKLEYLSYHDQLTGLYNRRFFEEELIRLNEKKNFPLTIVMADVNGLKLINDSFGHAVGDELIKKVAEIIKKGCRVNDIAARLGGDEFVILLPNTDGYETEKIVKNIKTLAIKEKVGVVDISISFGYETKNNEEEKIDEISKKAEDYMYKKKLFEGPSMRGKTISAIISTLHEKNKREEQHSHRVSILCQYIGKAYGLPEDETEELKTVGLLHDIGKIAIDENILNKPEGLTEDEWKEIKRHPEIGYRILNTVNDMSEIAEYVLAHHERWDGRGYPKGLRGREIPLQSRIIAIADSYDAMVSERSYREALPEEAAIEELKVNAGIQFDPELVNAFIEKVLGKH